MGQTDNTNNLKAIYVSFARFLLIEKYFSVQRLLLLLCLLALSPSCIPFNLMGLGISCSFSLCLALIILCLPSFLRSLVLLCCPVDAFFLLSVPKHFHPTTSMFPELSFKHKPHSDLSGEHRLPCNTHSGHGNLPLPYALITRNNLICRIKPAVMAFMWNKSK